MQRVYVRIGIIIKIVKGMNKVRQLEGWVFFLKINNDTLSAFSWEEV